METSGFVYDVEFYCFPITKITEHYLTDSGFEWNWFESNYLISLQIFSSLIQCKTCNENLIALLNNLIP